MSHSRSKCETNRKRYGKQPEAQRPVSQNAVCVQPDKLNEKGIPKYLLFFFNLQKANRLEPMRNG